MGDVSTKMFLMILIVFTSMYVLLGNFGGNISEQVNIMHYSQKVLIKSNEVVANKNVKESIITGSCGRDGCDPDKIIPAHLYEDKEIYLIMPTGTNPLWREEVKPELIDNIFKSLEKSTDVYPDGKVLAPTSQANINSRNGLYYITENDLTRVNNSAIKQLFDDSKIKSLYTSDWNGFSIYYIPSNLLFDFDLKLLKKVSNARENGQTIPPSLKQEIKNHKEIIERTYQEFSNAVVEKCKINTSLTMICVDF